MVQDLGQVTITAGRDANACGVACSLQNDVCFRESDRFLVFASSNLQTFSFVSNSPILPGTINEFPTFSLDDYQFTIEDPARYIAVCRNGAGHQATDIMVDSIVARP